MPLKKQRSAFLLPALFRKKVPNPALLAPDPAVLPLEWEEKEQIKARYASGREYFLFAGDIHPRHQLLTLLKAFSVFKKWQRSEMKLIIAGKTGRWTAKLEKMLATYKYREDVSLIRNPETATLRQLIAAAYAFVFPTGKEVFSVNILNAMQAKVPVISSRSALITARAGDHILHITGDTEEELAKCLLTIYKDESLRSALVNKAADFVKRTGAG